MTSLPSRTSTAFLRRVVLDAQPGAVTAALEDDFHHFVVTVRHDGQRVSATSLAAPRTPWSLCPEAALKLAEFVGQPLSARTALRPQGLDGKQHCTHQYDLAVVALSHALRSGRREYLMRVDDPANGHRVARLWRDGELLLDWRMHRTGIASSDEFNGRDLRDVLAWAATSVEDERLEALYLLRRAVMVSGGRLADLDQFDNASQIERLAGGCYAFQPERARQALRMPGYVRLHLQGHDELLPQFGPLSHPLQPSLARAPDSAA